MNWRKSSSAAAELQYNNLSTEVIKQKRKIRSLEKDLEESKKACEEQKGKHERLVKSHMLVLKSEQVKVQVLTNQLVYLRQLLPFANIEPGGPPVSVQEPDDTTKPAKQQKLADNELEVMEENERIRKQNDELRERIERVFKRQASFAEMFRHDGILSQQEGEMSNSSFDEVRNKFQKKTNVQEKGKLNSIREMEREKELHQLEIIKLKGKVHSLTMQLKQKDSLLKTFVEKDDQEDGLMGQMRKLEGISIQLMIDHASELENYQTQEGNLREELLNVQLENKSLRQRIYDIEQNDKGERESQTEFINAMTEKIEHLKLKQVKLTTTIAELVNQLRDVCEIQEILEEPAHVTIRGPGNVEDILGESSWGPNTPKARRRVRFSEQLSSITSQIFQEQFMPHLRGDLNDYSDTATEMTEQTDTEYSGMFSPMGLQSPGMLPSLMKRVFSGDSRMPVIPESLKQFEGLIQNGSFAEDWFTNSTGELKVGDSCRLLLDGSGHGEYFGKIVDAKEDPPLFLFQKATKGESAPIWVKQEQCFPNL